MLTVYQKNAFLQREVVTQNIFTCTNNVVKSAEANHEPFLSQPESSFASSQIKFSHHRSLPYPAGQPVTLVLPDTSYGDVGRLLQLVYLGRVR